mgnify:CR=1 FL=1
MVLCGDSLLIGLKLGRMMDGRGRRLGGLDLPTFSRRGGGGSGGRKICLARCGREFWGFRAVAWLQSAVTALLIFI